jgi:hypothetical protein
MTKAHTTEAHFVIACLEKGRDIPVASEQMSMWVCGRVGFFPCEQLSVWVFFV